MKTKKILMLLVALLFVSTLFAVNLRGQVRGYNKYNGYFPYVSVQVILYVGQQKSTVYTDKNGMYYFYNIPPGRYLIKIGNHEFWYDVNSTPSWQDIPVQTI